VRENHAPEKTHKILHLTELRGKPHWRLPCFSALRDGRWSPGRDREPFANENGPGVDPGR
jgi:hypothetical protein